jgi:hypothetical protein
MGEREPEIEARELPPEVAELREQWAAEHERLDALWQPAIDAHIEALALEVETVIEKHKSIGDQTNVEISGEARPSAIWQLSGRCLAICRVVLHDLRGGFTSESVGSLRTLWEAAILLGAVTSEHEEELLRRWLADEDGAWVRPGQARDAVERMEARQRERMREDGLELGRGMAEGGDHIYDLLSKPAHHRRGGFPETSRVDLRVFTYGPHPNAEVRAHYVDYAGQLIEMALIFVIDGLAALVGRAYVGEALAPMQDRLERVRERFPLPG